MKRLTLVDGNSLLFRAYYATAYPGAKLLQTQDGTYTNAVFAFAGMIQKIIELSGKNFLIAFDTKAPTKRSLVYQDYKAGRTKMPEELESQIPLIHELIKNLGLKEYSQDGIEADDIIGTLSKQANQAGYQVNIYSSDRDLLQLVSDQTTVNLLKKGMKEVESFTPEDIKTKYGLEYHQFIDLKALMGDPSDNIPGLPGVGEKTAIKLLLEYQTVENIIAKKDQIPGKLGEVVKNNEQLLILCKELSTIDTNVEIPFTVDQLEIQPINQEQLLNFLKRLELKHLVIEYQKKFSNNQIDTLETEPATTTIQHTYQVIETEDQLKEILNQDLAIYFEFSNKNYHKAQLWGVGLSDSNNHYFVDADLFLFSKSAADYLVSDYKKFTFNYKAIKVFLKWHNLDIKAVDYDLLLSAYIIKSSIGKEDFTAIVQSFGINDLPYDEQIYGSGVRKGLPLIVTDYYEHISKKAAIIYQLKNPTLKEIEERNQLSLLNDVELKLSDTLADMEFEGLLVDTKELEQQTNDLNQRIEVLRTKIHQLATKEFNIDSPKQLGDILFETLKLPNGRKTKTGYSTDAEVLKYLEDKHPIIHLVSEYRQLTKLYNTYLVGIKQVLFDDQKVHTIFNQALTLTGRLSSLEPNLQNIPIRTEEGKKIRKIFIPSQDSLLLGCDYSQIELRVLADIADVKALKEAFKNNEDIHTSTAKKIFHTDTVDSEQRRKAKAVNFGIIYGIGAWSLSEDINVTVDVAENFIKRYLEVYPEIKAYMHDIVEYAQTHGYVKTILERRRYIPELESRVYNLREFGKRTALNAPIQGSAADIIKVAMIKLDQYLNKNNKKSKLILQVHDELILNCHQSELEEMKQMVPKIMKEAIKTSVEFETSCDVGDNWYQLK